MNINKVAGYRKMLNMTQNQIAKELGISFASYNAKENQKNEFKDTEKKKLLDILKKADPTLTIERLFF
ncbi:helix-turn-helix domain-containing protein [Aerococcus christensenii]|uniref:helix-turn-helix domain-containing protein n=1 Tax=Aerococcus christensenii TaxID=87541 RepID=UPI003F435FA6